MKNIYFNNEEISDIKTNSYSNIDLNNKSTFLTNDNDIKTKRKFPKKKIDNYIIIFLNSKINEYSKQLKLIMNQKICKLNLIKFKKNRILVKISVCHYTNYIEMKFSNDNLYLRNLHFII